MTIGFVVSRTVTLKLDVDLLPALSVAVHVTVVVPKRKQAAGDRTADRRDRAVHNVHGGRRERDTCRPVAPTASATMSAGSVSTGALVSLTVTVKLAVALLPLASVAMQVTEVSPSGNSVPEAGVHTTVTGGEAVSVATGVV